jgi:hypothetical protein
MTGIGHGQTHHSSMPTSVQGQSRHFDSAPRTSALLRSADIADRVRQVRKVPNPDIDQLDLYPSFIKPD